MAKVTVIGAGVVGVVTAYSALRLGHSIRLLDEGTDRPSISWNGIRIIRDVCNDQNTIPWRKILAEIGAMDLATHSVTHWVGEKKMGDEPAAFLLDTNKVRTALMAMICEASNAEVNTGVTVVAVDDRKIRLSDGTDLDSDITIIAAGISSKGLIGQNAKIDARARIQVYASLRPGCDPMEHQAFIQHLGSTGVWGTPPIGQHLAKVSASDLCFNSQEEAQKFVGSTSRKAAFVDRVRKIYPNMRADDICEWNYGTYSDTRRQPIYHSGSVRGLIACNGGAFKRAPHISAALLSNIPIQ